MLEDHWYIACRARDLGRRPLRVVLFGRPLVLFRDRASRPAALEDRCLHRGAPLSRGRLVRGEIQCPYHGWRYDRQGGITHIPARPPGEPPIAGDRLRHHACVEQDGYIWTCPGRDPARDRPHAFPHLNEAGWTSFRMDTRFHAPVEACLENFLDCPHASFVHRFWFRTPAARLTRTLTRVLDDGAVSEYQDEPREKSVVWSLLSRRRATLHHSDRFIAPATSQVEYRFSDGRHYIITSSCTPIQARETRVHTVMSFRFGAIGPLIRLLFEPLSRLIIRQDVAMLRAQQDNLARFGPRGFRIIDQDLLIRHILAWRQALQEGTAPPQTGQETHVDMCL